MNFDLGIPRHMGRTSQGHPDWAEYEKIGPLQAQRAAIWRDVHTIYPIDDDILLQVSHWLEDNYHIPFLISIVYVVAIFGIQAVMKNKEPFGLKIPLAIWNLALSVFSIIGAFDVGKIILGEWFYGKGFLHDMCTPYAEHETVWILLFIFSKVPELIDTLFIVLRKKELIFLHWYHHIVTMWFCWFAWARRLDCGGAFALMNLCVHSIMYFYYACSAMGIYWPQWARQMITTLQLSQMVGGLAVLGTTYYHCPYDEPMLFGGFAMYFSYFVLFAILFVNLYCKKPTNTPKAKTK